MKKIHNSPKDNRAISFYDPIDEYFEFSNFYPRSIIIDNIEWKTSEHYYQAQKFQYELDRDIIRRAVTPKEAFLLSRSLDSKHVENWNAIRVSIMKQVLYIKFTTHQDLNTILLNTENRLIQEKSSVDDFWGIGSDGQGKNMMGMLLMELRETLQNL